MNAASMAPTPGDNLIEVRGLRKYLGSGPHPVRAVDDVSFAIRRGETLGLVGESGSGKSTIGRLLTRLVDPTAGQMLYHGEGASGQDLAAMSQGQFRPLRSKIQIIFQDPYASLNPRMRIREVLGEALDTHKQARGAARLPRIHELLTQVGLRPEHAERFPHEFSGGQRVRNTQPDGGLAGLGRSPCSRGMVRRCAGSGMGAAASRARV